ncbi:MAG: ABC transporter ATP-binding protein [Propionibacteriaceae bacterium]|jgi:putative ABC transport system ATP-binding protein|nr:ABC transporter ATP-binding protein [Propionibacteriaceae bacterium]
MSQRTAQIVLRDVNKLYPGHPPLHVLKDVNLKIYPGEFVAIVGPSGSGKTTMLSIMGTLDQPTTGEVWIDGVNAAQISEVDRAMLRSDVVGFVFQQFFLLPALTAVDNVAEGMLYQRIRRSERRQRAFEALEMVGLSPRAQHKPGELSGGEQQRVAIARAIAGQPQVLFADEPTGALDQATGHMIVDYLRAIANQGTTVIVITHDQTLANRFDRKISFLDGEIVADKRRRSAGRPGVRKAARPGPARQPRRPDATTIMPPDLVEAL